MSEKRVVGTPLTPDEIAFHDELFFNRKGIETVLKIALTHAANKTNFFAKQNKKLWDQILDARGLNPDKTYETGYYNGQRVIFEVTNDE